MTTLKLFLLVIFISGCSSSSKDKTSDQLTKMAEKKPNLVEQKKKDLPDKVVPLKGKFLDYVNLISPEHKARGYSINTYWLGDGYAYGEGPYDGWMLEFFLFRGKSKDLVFSQRSGYETDLKNSLYGYEITPYFFKNNKMTKAELKDVFPIKKIEQLFDKQTKMFKSVTDLTHSEREWKFFKLMRLPLKGTTIELKICRDEIEPPFEADSPCALVGVLKWNKSNFRLESVGSFETSQEHY